MKNKTCSKPPTSDNNGSDNGYNHGIIMGLPSPVPAARQAHLGSLELQALQAPSVPEPRQAWGLS